MAATTTESEFETTVREDRIYIVSHVFEKMLQAGSLVAPPAYAALALARRRPLVVSELLRRSARTTYVYFGSAGILMGTARMWNEPGVAIQDRAFRLRANAAQARADTFAHAGFLLGAGALAMAPAARFGALVDRASGGAALGIAAGVLAHLVSKAKEEGVQAVKQEVEGSLPVKVFEDAVQSKS